jgi:hypothetical protein
VLWAEFAVVVHGASRHVCQRTARSWQDEEYLLRQTRKAVRNLELRRGEKAKTPVILRMPEDDDERTSSLKQLTQSISHKGWSYARMLVLWCDRQEGEYGFTGPHSDIGDDNRDRADVCRLAMHADRDSIRSGSERRFKLGQKDDWQKNKRSHLHSPRSNFSVFHFSVNSLPIDVIIYNLVDSVPKRIDHFGRAQFNDKRQAMSDRLEGKKMKIGSGAIAALASFSAHAFFTPHFFAINAAVKESR